MPSKERPPGGGASEPGKLELCRQLCLAHKALKDDVTALLWCLESSRIVCKRDFMRMRLAVTRSVHSRPRPSLLDLLRLPDVRRRLVPCEDSSAQALRPTCRTAAAALADHTSFATRTPRSGGGAEKSPEWTGSRAPHATTSHWEPLLPEVLVLRRARYVMLRCHGAPMTSLRQASWATAAALSNCCDDLTFGAAEEAPTRWEAVQPRGPSWGPGAAFAQQGRAAAQRGAVAADRGAPSPKPHAPPSEVDRLRRSAAAARDGAGRQLAGDAGAREDQRLLSGVEEKPVAPLWSPAVSSRQAVPLAALSSRQAEVLELHSLQQGLKELLENLFLPDGSRYRTGVISDGKLFVLTHPKFEHAKVDLFDPINNAWYALPEREASGRMKPAVTVSRGHLYLVGGEDEMRKVMLRSAERLDLSARRPYGKWEELPVCMRTRRQSAAAAGLKDGSVLVCGGSAQTEDQRRVAPPPLDSVEVLTPTDKGFQWTRWPPMPTARARHAAAMAGEHVLVCGGGTADLEPLATCELCDPDTRTWCATQPMRIAREAPLALALAGSLYVFSGWRGCGHNAGKEPSAERFDPETGTWELLVPSEGAT